MKVPSRRLVLLGLVLATAGALPWASAQGAAPKDAPGLAVGAKAPGFVLPAQDGREHSLAEWLKRGQVALVFYRSAEW